MSIRRLTSVDAVKAAMQECDKLGRDQFLRKYGFRYSRLYPLNHDGRIYDSKAIAGVAYGKQYGTPLRPREFVGGMETVIPVLRRPGFNVVENQHPLAYLRVGRTYLRKDLLERFGGQIQSGIWTPREFPVVFIFSGESGEAYGYCDGWNESDGTFRYTGEGQVGDMKFTKGNLAVRDHRDDKRDLLLFTDLPTGKGVRFEGVFEQASWEYVPGKDRNGDDRKMIVFSLVPVAAAGIDEPTTVEIAPKVPSLAQLRKAALAAAAAAANKESSPAKGDARRI